MFICDGVHMYSRGDSLCLCKDGVGRVPNGGFLLAIQRNQVGRSEHPHYFIKIWLKKY